MRNRDRCPALHLVVLFLADLESRLSERGLFVLDEPEAALSFTSCLRLLALMGLIADSGSQVLLATHSPLLAAFPGARVLEFTDGGIEQRQWQELDLVTHWQAFLAQAGRLPSAPVHLSSQADGTRSGRLHSTDWSVGRQVRCFVAFHRSRCSTGPENQLNSLTIRSA